MTFSDTVSRTKSGNAIRIKQRRELLKKMHDNAEMEKDKISTVPFLVSKVRQEQQLSACMTTQGNETQREEELPKKSSRDN